MSETKKLGGRRDVDMTEGNIFRHLVGFAIPLLLGNIFQQMYNMVDTWVVGNFVSTEAYSAVGTLGSVTNLMIGFFMGLANGVGVVIARAYGAGDHEKVQRTVHSAAALTLVMGAAFTVIGFGLMPVIPKMLRLPEEVVDEARIYLAVWLSGLIGLMTFNMGAGVLRAVGDSRRPFIFLVIAAIVNTGLDLLFVLVLKWGVAGVAAATIIAQTMSGVLTTITLIRTKNCIKLSPRRIRFHRDVTLESVKIGFPAGLQMSITAFSNIFVQSYINYFGKEVMGGWTTYSKVDQLILLPMQSLSLASSTFVGQNVGKGDLKRAKRGVNVALLSSLAATATLIIPVVIFSGFFADVFTDDPKVLEYGSTFLRTITPFYILWSVNQIYSGALRGSGNSIGPMVIMLTSFVAFRQLYLFVMANFISNTIFPISMAFPAGWLLSAIITFIYYHAVGLKGKRYKPQNQQSENDTGKEETK